jgi:hypothetical protein
MNEDVFKQMVVDLIVKTPPDQWKYLGPTGFCFDWHAHRFTVRSAYLVNTQPLYSSRGISVSISFMATPDYVWADFTVEDQDFLFQALQQHYNAVKTYMDGFHASLKRKLLEALETDKALDYTLWWERK